MTQAAAETGQRIKPPRVGYLLWMYPRFSQTFILNEMIQMLRRGLDLRIASLRKPIEGRFHELACQICTEVRYIPETICGHVPKTTRLQGNLLRRSPRDYFRAVRRVAGHRGANAMNLVQAGYLVHWARKRRLDHLHVHFGTGEATVAWLARGLGGPRYSLALHAVDIFRKDVDRTLLARKINDSAFTIVNTAFNRRFVLENLPGLDGTKVRLCYNGVDPERFRPTARRRRPNTILSIGRLVEKKGFLHLARAVAQLRDEGMTVKCKIVGEGPMRERIKDEIARLNLRGIVVLTSPMQHEGIRELLERYACFALPCIPAADGNMDGVPNVVLEALAAGCPVVTTPISGIPEVVEDGATGLTVRPGDERELADAMRRLLTEPALCERLARAGRSRVVEQFSMDRNLGTIYNWLVEAAHAARDAQRPADIVETQAIPAPSVPAGGPTR